MGDLRYGRALERARSAHDASDLDRVSPETGLQALAALARDEDALLANVLATRLLNQFRRSATLLRHIPDGVLALDADGRILFANPAAEHMLGWEPGELLGRDLHETVDHRRGGKPLPRGECAILRALEGAPGEEGAARWQFDRDEFRRLDGSRFIAGLAVAPMMDGEATTGAAVVFRDISAQKAHEDDLVLSRVALEAVPIPIFWLGHDARVLYANPAAAEHLGWTPAELAEMHVFDFDLDFEASSWPDHWDRVRRGEVRAVESRHRTREGRVVRVHIDLRHVGVRDAQMHVALVRVL